MKILLLDNYDSFTFNLLHYLQNTGAEVFTVRNNEITPSQFDLVNFDAAVLSPGPCTPKDAGKLMDFVKHNLGRKPMLGVCLGMQAIGLQYGWELVKASIPVHGKSSMISHNSTGIFEGIENPMQAGRYHSLIIKQNGETALKTDADYKGETMAVSDVSKKIWGVQFHPESILTPHGQQLIDNWVNLVKIL